MSNIALENIWVQCAATDSNLAPDNDSRSLPSFLQPSKDLPAHPIKAVSHLRAQIRATLLTTGAVVLRGFGINSVQEFKTIADTFSDGGLLDYAGGASPRTLLTGGVYTSTEYPPEMPLALHNELSYSAAFPRTLFFYCDVEPNVGGETTLGDSRKILAAIDPEIAEQFRSKGVLYVRNLVSDRSSPYSWQAAFETDGREKVENICKRQGSEFGWTKNGELRISFVGPATIKHPETGDEVWFNQADGFHSGTLQHPEQTQRPRLESYFGDGSEVSAEILQHIGEVIRNETIPHKWQQGDVLIVDNILAAHGRMTFAGPRKIVLAMA